MSSKMRYEINGGNLPVLKLKLDNGDSVFAAKGRMAWMSEHMEMKTSSKGGLLKGFARTFAGDAMFLNIYTAIANNQEISFSPPTAGEIKNIVLNPGDEIIAQKGAFMVAEHSVNLSIAFHKKISAGFFGGEGFVLQKMNGEGNVFLEIDGALIEKTLKPSEVLKVDPGYVAYFDSSVNYSMTFIKGIKNIVLGGEGMLILKLTGPGRVGLQTLPLSKLANSLYPYLPKNR